MAKKRRAQSRPKDDRKKRSYQKSSNDDDVEQKNSAEVTAVSNALFRNSDIGTVIFSFLEARELLRLASCSKDYLARLSYKNVVISSLMTGGRPKVSLQRIGPLIRQRKIWIPTPQRLLRLVCGKRCERCNLHRVMYVSDSYGVFFCSDCIHECSQKVGHSKKWSPYVTLPRVSSHLFKEDYLDATGALCGPIVTKQKIEEFMEDISIPPSEQISSYLALCDASQPTANTDANEVVEAYFETIDAAMEREDERKEQKKLAKQLFHQARQTKADQLIEELVGLVGDVPWKWMFQYRTWTLKHFFWEKYGYTFCNNIMQKVLSEALKTPSKVTKRKLKELANELSEEFETQAKADALMDKLFDLAGPIPREKEKILERKWNVDLHKYEFHHSSLVNKTVGALEDPDTATDTMLEELAEQLREILFKRENSERLLRELSVLIKDARWKEVVSSARWCTSCYTHEFGESRVQGILDPALANPSKIKGEKLVELAQYVNDSFDKVNLLEELCDDLMKNNDSAIWKSSCTDHYVVWDANREWFGIRDPTVDRILEPYLYEPARLTAEDKSRLVCQIQRAHENEKRALKIHKVILHPQCTSSSVVFL